MIIYMVYKIKTRVKNDVNSAGVDTESQQDSIAIAQ